MVAQNGHRQTGASATVENFNVPEATPLDDPKVAYYTEHTAPTLKGYARAVFRELGRYLNPSEPYSCWPSQTRIAYSLDITRSQVRTAVYQLELAKLIRIEQKAGAPGSQNVYLFDHGFNCNFDPPIHKELVSEIPACNQVLILQAENTQLRELLTAHGIQIPTQSVAEQNHPEERESHAHEEVNTSVTHESLSLDSNGDLKASGDKKSQLAIETTTDQRDSRASQIREFVYENTGVVIGPERWQFDHRAGAISKFTDDENEYQLWRTSIERHGLPPRHPDNPDWQPQPSQKATSYPKSCPDCGNFYMPDEGPCPRCFRETQR